MSVTADVVVLGSLHLDVMVQAPALPRLGETAVGHAWSLMPGGKGGNQAVAAARHGATVAMVGAVGDDEFGRRLLAHLRDNGVDTSHVPSGAGAASGMSVAISEASGDYGAVIVSGANLTLDAGAVAAADALIGGARWLLLQNEVPDAANLAAAQVAHRAGCKVMLNAAPARPPPPGLVPLIDMLVVNALEAEALCGIAVTDAACALAAAVALRAGDGAVIVTAGGAGLALAGADGTRAMVAAHAVPVVSTHGAGDTFVGALAAQLALGAPLEAAVRYANAAAALLVASDADARSRLGPDAVVRLLSER